MAFWNRKPPQEPVVEPVPEPDLKPTVASKPEPKRRRSETMKLRLAPDELEYLTQQAETAGMSRTDYIMAAATGSPVIVIDEVPQLLLELRRQGANLNQMVRLAHQTHSTNLPELMAAVQRCAEAQAEVVRMCDYWNMKLRKEDEEHGDHNDQGLEGDAQ